MASKRLPVFSFFCKLLWISSLAGTINGMCDFPKSLQMNRYDPPWYSQVMDDGTRNVEYYIRHDIMEIHYPHKTSRSRVRWTCTMSTHDMLLLKRQDFLTNSYYRCARFVIRSDSILQIMWSHESKVLDLDLCKEDLLKLDPWPLIAFDRLENDYTPSPFSGGFDMKIIDSEFGESGCNLMDRPMRLESDCIGGEGVLFDFISNECLPDRIHMMVKQRTISVASWKDRRNHYVVLRRLDRQHMWCLVMPIRIGAEGNVTAYLYPDLICRYDSEHSRSIPNDLKVYSLVLQRHLFLSLCEDEYEECKSMPCGMFFTNECQRSCGVCDPRKPPPACTFPRRFLGSWFQKDPDGYKQISMESSTFSVQNVGEFRCVDYPDSPSRKSGNFTTVSIFSNGCRPRYTCIRFHRLGPDVLRYSLGQSIAWPTLVKDFGKTMCDPQKFHQDPSPIEDMYRSYADTGKPIIAQSSTPQTVPCNISSVLTLSATLPSEHVCSGLMYQHCEDKTKVRIEFGSCGSLVPAATDYRCLATYDGHYWESILLLQNLNDQLDVICIIFNSLPAYANDAFVMVASQCDMKSFNFAHAGLRKPLMSLKYRSETEPCQSVPVEVPTTATAQQSQNGVPSSHGSMRDDGPSHGHYKNGSGDTNEVSIYVTVPIGSKTGASRPETGKTNADVDAVHSEKNGHLLGASNDNGRSNGVIIKTTFSSLVSLGLFLLLTLYLVS